MKQLDINKDNALDIAEFMRMLNINPWRTLLPEVLQNEMRGLILRDYQIASDSDNAAEDLMKIVQKVYHMIHHTTFYINLVYQELSCDRCRSSYTPTILLSITIRRKAIRRGTIPAVLA